MRLRLIQKILSVILLIVVLMNNLANAVGLLINSTDKLKQRESLESAASTEIVLDEQFLEFHNIGETKKLTASGISGKLEYVSSNPESVKVDESGNVTWVSGTKPVTVTVSSATNKNINTQCFVSFEGEIQEEVANSRRECEFRNI
jgi:hypothetical protein